VFSSEFREAEMAPIRLWRKNAQSMAMLAADEKIKGDVGAECR
jgi:hypothetical protein